MEALLGILFALLVLVPILLLVGNFSRLSSQATDNFRDFTTVLDSMSHSKNMDDRRSHLLIMDDETMIASFSDRQISVQVDTDAVLLTAYTIQIQKPSACTTTRCICLIQKAEVESIPSDDRVLVTPLESRCVDVDYNIGYVAGDRTCGVGESVHSATYKCSGGWFVDRGMIKGEWLVSVYFSVQRRTYLVIGPREGGVAVGLSRKVIS